MVDIVVEYIGDLKCRVTHKPSGNFFYTDAPLDNNGKAEFISPTDLLAASIGSCISTIFAIKIQNENIDFNGFKILVSKDMINEPFRRVNKLILNIYIPKSFDERLVKILENVVKSCPVTRSLLPEITIVKNYIYLEN